MKELKLNPRVFYLWGCMAAAFAFAPTPADAEFVFDSEVSLNGSEFPLLLASDPDNFLLAADRFSLETSTVIHGVDWWGSHAESPSAEPSGTFTLQFFKADVTASGDGSFDYAPSSNGPILTRSLGTGSPTTAPPGILDGLHAYSADISGVELGAGDYYLSIFNTTSVDTENNWFWLAAGRPNGTAYLWDVPRVSWTNEGLAGNATAAFRLRGVTAVPEPASLATLAFCLTVGCGGAGRLWRKRHQPQSGDAE